MTDEKRQRSLGEELQGVQPPDWVREAQKHYQETGSYRAKDLARIMGDQTKGVEGGAAGSDPFPSRRR
jgi:hypothetical protein